MAGHRATGDSFGTERRKTGRLEGWKAGRLTRESPVVQYPFKCSIFQAGEMGSWTSWERKRKGNHSLELVGHTQGQGNQAQPHPSVHRVPCIPARNITPATGNSLQKGPFKGDGYKQAEGKYWGNPALSALSQVPHSLNLSLSLSLGPCLETFGGRCN